MPVKTIVLFAALIALFTAFGYGLFGVEGAAWCLTGAAIVNGWTYWLAAERMVKAFGAFELDYRDDPLLIEKVRSLAAKAGIDPPKVYLTNCRQPNAFTAGRNPDNSIIVISRSLRRLLNRDELAAAIGHEIAHIRARDTLNVTVAATIVSALAGIGIILGLIGLAFSRKGGGLALIFLGVLAPVIGLVLAFAVGREREYEADRVGARLCDDPRSLISALRKLDDMARAVPNPAALAHPATMSVFIVCPCPDHPLAWLFSTHPRVSKRIARLEKLLASG